MTQTARPSEARDRRSVERKSVNLPGRLIFEGGTEDCRVYDISPQGAHISASSQAPINLPVRLKLTEHGEFVGQIVWRRGERMGIKFFHVGEERIDLPLKQGPGIRLIS
ncbi:MAG: PilZ domain-containing protein [Kiloniellales bacterium]|nr:PilZ domain-containing protein [Kiloniellales bacterium]